MKKTKRIYRKFEMSIEYGIYDKIARDTALRKIEGKNGEEVLVMGTSPHIAFIKKDYKSGKEIIKINSSKPQAMQSELELMTGVKLSLYRID